jgi:TetR/AcrR family transcriptional regulator, regulator of cefoperazone and chloramphenicol sensitivity
MKIQREDSARTRQRLIEAASEVFAKKDYGVATVAEICSLAKANISAVNYHFNDKETLYREAWRYAFHAAITAHPVHGGVDDSAPPEEHLKGLIRAFILRTTDENDREAMIVHREISNPTGLLEEVIEKELTPIRVRLEGVVAELLGAASSPERVLHCAVSIMNQCHHPMLLTQNLQFDAKALKRPRLDMSAFIDHVVVFSLGGIRAIAENADR